MIKDAMDKKQHEPFKQLGERLKRIRQKLHESVAEVSGAVEIDEPTLQRIEQGWERPSEDILMLLISHFGMHDDEATGLWRLAGYNQAHSHESSSADDISAARTAILVMAPDPRVIYSDGVQVHATNSGVVIAFSQNSGVPNSFVTTRVGMSREQAQAVAQALQEALVRTTPRQLPGGGERKREDRSK